MIKNKGQALLVSVIIVGFASVAAALYLIPLFPARLLLAVLILILKNHYLPPKVVLMMP